jgi:hypothetical protein
MKIMIISALSLMGFFSFNVAAFDSATFMEKLDKDGSLVGLSDDQMDELQNSFEQGLILSEQNGEMFFLSSIGSAFKSIKDLLSSAAGKVKAGFTTVADLTKRGFSKAAALAEKLGVTDMIKEIPSVVAEAGAATVEAFIQGLFDQKFGGT